MSSTNKSLTERYAELQRREAAFERRKAIEPELKKFVEKGNITLAQKSAFSDIFAAIPNDLELSFLACDGKDVYEFLWYFLNHLNSPTETASFAAPKKKNCSKGVSCGNACISGGKVCRKPLTPIQKEEVKEVLAVAPVPAKVAPIKTKPELSDAGEESKTKANSETKPKSDTEYPSFLSKKDAPPNEQRSIEIAGQMIEIKQGSMYLTLPPQLSGLAVHELSFYVNGKIDAQKFDERTGLKIALGVRKELKKEYSKLKDGTIVNNYPWDNDDKGESRKRLYSSFGFGEADEEGNQWGVMQNGKVLPINRKELFKLAKLEKSKRKNIKNNEQ